MSLIRYEPNNMMNRLRDQLTRFHEPDVFPGLWEEEGGITTSNWTPSVDVKEDDKQYTFLADIPGVDPKEIDVTLRGRCVDHQR